MLDGLFNFFEQIATFFTNLFGSIKTFFDTIILVPTIAPWLVRYIPSFFAPLVTLGIAFIVVKIIKDLL